MLGLILPSNVSALSVLVTFILYISSAALGVHTPFAELLSQLGGSFVDVILPIIL